MILRILASLVLLISILFMPFWLSVVLALIGMIYFSFYWEGVLLFFISDLLYGVKEAKFLNMYFIALFGSFIILMVIEFVKKKVRISK